MLTSFTGKSYVVGFEIMGYRFMAISAGPQFTINPSISFSLNMKNKKDVLTLWKKLSPGGQILMKLGKYPFSDYFGWLNDKYGVSWQLIALGKGTHGRPSVTPALMFTKERAGKAEEAMHFYTSVFKDSRIGQIFRYTPGQEPEKEGTVAHAVFFLEGQEFMALDSVQSHDFTFNEAISLMVNCKGQKEIDYFWDKLSALPEAEQCGWAKDKYGVSWQILPENMGELMSNNPEKITSLNAFDEKDYH